MSVVFRKGNVSIKKTKANKYKIDYISDPLGYFKLKQDNLMSEILKCPLSEYLYGRCNKITDNNGYTIADIVEVLPCR